MLHEASIQFAWDGNALTLHARTWLRRPVADVFPFFTDAGNLDALTPPWLKFHIVTRQPIDMNVGARIDYRLRIHGLPMRWQSEITVWEPPVRFVDEQRRGPYRLWIHEHRFEACEGGTTVFDDVRYAVPGGRLVDRLLIRRDLRTIFGYRQKRLQEIFQSPLLVV